MNLYRENILDHYKNPRNKHALEDADVKHREANPLCGDVVEIFLKIEKGKVKEASFEGEGCAISVSSASMLTEELQGKTIEEIMKMDKQAIVNMLGVDPGASRIKCATLALKSTLLGIYEKYGKKAQAETEL